MSLKVLKCVPWIMSNNFFFRTFLITPPYRAPKEKKYKKRPSGHLPKKFPISANWPLAGGPPPKYTINHALNCHRGGYVIIRHNAVRDFLAEQLSTVCSDVQVEPICTS